MDLPRFIHRCIVVQRDFLDGSGLRLAEVPGPILQFGLGSSRAYDRLRDVFPTRQSVVFECLAGHLSVSAPPHDDLVGDLWGTIQAFPNGIAALVIADIETGVVDDARAVSPYTGSYPAASK